MSFLVKADESGQTEYILNFNPCNLGLFYQFTSSASINLKEVVFQSLEDFSMIDVNKLPLSTRLTVILPLRELKDQFRESRREIYLLVEINFEDFNKRPTEYFEKLQALNNVDNLSYSIYVRRSQYESFAQSIEKINHFFKSPVDFTLEYFDSYKNTENIINFWKSKIGELTTSDNFQTMTFPFYNRTHNFIKRRTLVIEGTQIFLSPQLYQNLNQGFKELEVTSLSLNQIEEKINALSLQQLQFAESTDECSDCKNLIFCSGRLTLKALEELDYKSCPYPLSVVERINAE